DPPLFELNRNLLAVALEAHVADARWIALMTEELFAPLKAARKVGRDGGFSGPWSAHQHRQAVRTQQVFAHDARLPPMGATIDEIGGGLFEGYTGSDVHVRGQRLVERGQDRIRIGLC